MVTNINLNDLTEELRKFPVREEQATSPGTEILADNVEFSSRLARNSKNSMREPRAAFNFRVFKSDRLFDSDIDSDGY